MKVPAFSAAVQRAVDGGLEAAAILDEEGKPFAVAGALDDDEARAIAALVTRMTSKDLLSRMVDGKLVTRALDDRKVSVGIVARCVFIVVVRGDDPEKFCWLVDDLRRDVEQVIHAERSGSFVPRPPSGGSSSGPAELPVIELGVTVRRRGQN